MGLLNESPAWDTLATFLWDALRINLNCPPDEIPSRSYEVISAAFGRLLATKNPLLTFPEGAIVQAAHSLPLFQVLQRNLIASHKFPTSILPASVELEYSRRLSRRLCQCCVLNWFQSSGSDTFPSAFVDQYSLIRVLCRHSH